MKRTLLLVSSLLGAAACTVQEPVRPQPAAPAAQPAAQAPAPAAAAIEIPKLISQDEADAKAAQAIDKANADLELEKLKKELSGG